MRYVILLGAIGAAIAAYIAYWFHVSDRWQDGIAAWTIAREAEGADASYAGIDSAGFPFRLIITVAEPRLALPQRAGRPAWDGDELAILTHPWNPAQVLFKLSGENILSFDDGQDRRRLIVTAGQALGSYHVDHRGRPLRLSVDLHGLDVAEPATGMRLQAERAQFHARPGERPGSLLDLAIKAENVRAEGFGGELEGEVLALASLEASVRDAAPRLDLPLDLAIADWSRRGGALEIASFELVWGKVRLEASGTLALDEQMRPIGALTARISGHRELIEAAVAAGEMTSKDARTAGPVLDLLAAANGGVLSVPLSLQDGQIFLGPVAVGTLSPLFVGGRNPPPESPAPLR